MSTTQTGIAWCDRTWNPVRGCSRVSRGCEHCYAERTALRFSGGTKTDTPSPFHGFVTKVNGHASWTGKVELVEKALSEPLKWRRPCRVFVNSMSDLFHENLTDDAIDRVFAVMALCPHLTFQVLTKRPERMRKYLSRGVDDEFMRDRLDEAVQEFEACHANMDAPERWPLPNVWLGVSVEDRKHRNRIDILRETPAVKRFVSFEPLLEDLGELDLTGIDWAIWGGESGPGARPLEAEWIRRGMIQASICGTKNFVKQFGSFWALNHGTPIGRDVKGGDPAEWPEWARVREFPS
jgi:protein gp37